MQPLHLEKHPESEPFSEQAANLPVERGGQMARGVESDSMRHKCFIVGFLTFLRLTGIGTREIFRPIRGHGGGAAILPLVKGQGTERGATYGYSFVGASR
jgi:hypothetical protein